MITRDNAFVLLNSHLKSPQLIKHSLAVALVMEHLATHFQENPDKWYITGLLHDIDYDNTYDKPEQHGLIAMDLLKDTDIEQDMKDAILSHTGNSPINTLIDKALWVADPVTGLVIATALMTEDKRVESVKLSSLIKKFKNKNFAAGANREQIASCESLLNIPLNDFLELSRLALTSLS